jgi:hypothetical protein
VNVSPCELPAEVRAAAESLRDELAAHNASVVDLLGDRFRPRTCPVDIDRLRTVLHWLGIPDEDPAGPGECGHTVDILGHRVACVEPADHRDPHRNRHGTTWRPLRTAAADGPVAGTIRSRELRENCPSDNPGWMPE